ncbi:MAG TPA: Calx-beta domain-containing protein, partial [Nitrospirota bacterium]|nr:Calx-beta domain-containing protein [Nitrospirota bacterium]
YALPVGVLSFEPGETSKTLVVDIKDHGIYDDDKTVELALKNPKNAVLGVTAVHTHTIIISGESEQTTGVSRAVLQAKANTETTIKDVSKPLMMLAMAEVPGDAALMPVMLAAKTEERRVGIPKPTVAFMYASSRGSEKVSTVRVPVALSGMSRKPVTVEYGVTGGTAVRGLNYILKDGSLTFKPGETVKTIEINIKDNGVNEPDRSIDIRLKNPRGAVLGGNAAYTYTIMDSDPEPAVTFMSVSQQVKESAGKATIGVELSAVSGWDVIVPLMVGGTAKTPGNFTMPSGPVVIKAGKRSAAITVQVTDNGVNEDDKTVVVSMGVPMHGVQGKTTMSTITIINTNPEPTVTFTSASQQVKGSAGKATIGVELSAVSGRDVTIPLMVGGTTKTPGNYAITPGPIVIKAGERSAEITVQVTDNGVKEDNETVVVSMGVPTHAAQGKTTTSTVAIVNTDPGTAVSFTSASSSGEEEISPVRLEVILSAASGRPVTVEYGVEGGTAIQGKDFALQGGPLTFAPGETTKEIMVDIKNHGIYNDDKTFEVILKNPKNAVLGSSAVHTYTITNNHPKPTVTIRSTNQRLRKSAGRADITIQLSEVSDKDVIVPFMVSGTAIQGKDFTITPSPAVIKAGKRSAEIAVTMKDNNVPIDADKTVEVKLLNPDNAFLGLPWLYRLVMVKDAIPTIAVVPFFNGSPKKNAGDIMMFQFVKELRKLEDFVVIEPGVVRQQFLNMRVIMYEGISSSDIDLITSNIDADLILTGKIMDYQDDIALYGEPKVAFSVMLIDRSSKRIIWASRSSNKGHDAVTLFDWGSVNSANEMVSEMVRILRKRVVTW